MFIRIEKNHIYQDFELLTLKCECDNTFPYYGHRERGKMNKLHENSGTIRTGND